MARRSSIRRCDCDVRGTPVMQGSLAIGAPLRCNKICSLPPVFGCSWEGTVELSQCPHIPRTKRGFDTITIPLRCAKRTVLPAHRYVHSGSMSYRHNMGGGSHQLHHHGSRTGSHYLGGTVVALPMHLCPRLRVTPHERERHGSFMPAA